MPWLFAVGVDSFLRMSLEPTGTVHGTFICNAFVSWRRVRRALMTLPQYVGIEDSLGYDLPRRSPLPIQPTRAWQRRNQGP